MIVDPTTENVVTTAFNELYGHAQILRDYVGIQDKRILLCGELQHGWSAGDQASADQAKMGPNEPFYVWNDRSEKIAHDSGLSRPVIKIGSPFLYLGPHDDVPRAVPSGLLAFPEHATPGHPFVDRVGTFEAYADWLSDLRKREGFEAVTVCLHVNDYDDISVRRVFQRHGLSMTSCGAWYGSPRFLFNLRGLVLAHHYVTTNTIGSPTFFSASLGKPTFVGGPCGRRRKIETLGETYHPQVADSQWIAENFPEFTKGLDVDIKETTGIALRELGAPYKRDPWTLFQILRFGFFQRA